MASSDKVIQGLATYGRVKSTFQTVIVVLVSILFFFIGIYWARSSAKDPHTKTTVAKLKNVKCSSTFSETKDKNGNVTRNEIVNCNGDADYTVSGVKYTASSLSFPTRVQEGQDATIWYNPTNLNDVISGKPVPAFFGYVVASVACIVGIGSVVYTYLVNKNRTFAAIHGTKEAIDDAGDVLRGVFRGGDGGYYPGSYFPDIDYFPDA